jgi:hypothetical protein
MGKDGRGRVRLGGGAISSIILSTTCEDIVGVAEDGVVKIINVLPLVFRLSYLYSFDPRMKKFLHDGLV